MWWTGKCQIIYCRLVGKNVENLREHKVWQHTEIFREKYFKMFAGEFYENIKWLACSITFY